MIIFDWEWDFQYTDYTQTGDMDGLIVWEQARFWSLQLNLPNRRYEEYKEPWFYINDEAKYDGVPYYCSRIGFIYFVWGQQGFWGNVDRIRKER
jgi:hypothetical protein